MCEVVSLSDYKKKIEEKKKVEEAEELASLQSMVDQVMKSLGEIEPEPYNPYLTDQQIDNLIYGGLTHIGPSETALFNAYYTLFDEGREDLAELVMEIIKMK